MGTFILVVVVFCIGIFFGKAYEVGKRINNSASPVPAIREKQYELATNEGYQRGRMKIPQYMTLEETALALHRLEGLGKAMVDNTSDMKGVINSYGTKENNNNPTA